MAQYQGIDVSKYQGRIDWAKVKADGIQFAMLRAGVSGADGNLTVDRCFYRNLRQATAAGVNAGVYVYLLAESEEAAANAARQAIAMTEGYEITYPIACDFEDRAYYSGTRERNTALARAFLEEVQKEAFYPILYTFTAFANEYLNMEALADYDLWIADYRAQVGYPGSYTMWQHSAAGRVGGISTDVDLDTCYLDYPVLLREQGKNNLRPADGGKWRIAIYSFKKHSRAKEVAGAFLTLGLYCEVVPNGAEWAIDMYSFSERERADQVSAAIRTLGYYNEVHPMGA